MSSIWLGITYGGPACRPQRYDICLVRAGSESRIVSNWNQNKESDLESEPESFTNGALLTPTALCSPCFRWAEPSEGVLILSQPDTPPLLLCRTDKDRESHPSFWRCGAPRWPGLASGGGSGSRQEETTGTKREHYFNLARLLIPASAVIQELQLCASQPPPHEPSITVSAALQSRLGSLCLLSSPLSFFFFLFYPLRHALLSKDDAGCMHRKHNVLRGSSVAFNFPIQRHLPTRLPFPFGIPPCISHAGSLNMLSTGHIRKSIIDTCCQALSVIRCENDLTCNEL